MRGRIKYDVDVRRDVEDSKERKRERMKRKTEGKKKRKWGRKREGRN